MVKAAAVERTRYLAAAKRMRKLGTRHGWTPEIEKMVRRFARKVVNIKGLST